MDAREWMRREYPEDECIDQGNPFLAIIVRDDEIISDHTVNCPWLGVTDAEAEAVVADTRQHQSAYELAVLDRWWQLPPPQPP